METFAFPTLEGEPLPRTTDDTDALVDAARAEGAAAGRAEADAELAPQRDALAGAAVALAHAVDALLPQLERRAVELALALAGKIVHAAIEVQPERVCAVATGALRRVVARDQVVIVVNPADVDTVAAALPAIEAELGEFPRLEVAGERRIGRGGCIVRTVEGEIDAQLDAQLARAADLLREPC